MSAQTAGPSQPDVRAAGRRKRVYEEWKGSEVFFCGGFCMAGPSWKSLIGSTALIVAPSIVFWALVVPKFLPVAWIAILFWAISIALTSICLSFLFVTACIDPGVLPRNSEPDPEFLAGRRPRTTEVMVNGHKVVVRYNETCGFYQPPRAHHCSVNDNCIERFDHHCPWVGTTIGKRNYRFFLLFVFCTTLLCLFVFGVCLYQFFFLHAKLTEEDEGATWGTVIQQSIPALVILIYCFALCWFVGGLSGFHSFLVSTNQTTYENFRYGHDGRPNPYNRGCPANWAEVFCGPTPKSKVQPRAWADEWKPVTSVLPPGTVEAPRVPTATENHTQPPNGRNGGHNIITVDSVDLAVESRTS
eukprot:jgi/Tetstr1/421854/TSEL_012754.t1